MSAPRPYLDPETRPSAWTARLSASGRVQRARRLELGMDCYGNPNRLPALLDGSCCRHETRVIFAVRLDETGEKSC